MTKAQAEKLKEIPKLLKAIKDRCMDCSAYQINELKNCHLTECSLHRYRLGTLSQKNKKNPFEKSLNSSKIAIVQESSNA